MVFASSEEDNFRFIFGGKEISMNRYYADFISQRVSHIHQSDPTIDSITLNFNSNTSKIDQFIDSDLIDKIKQISMGEPIELNEVQSDKLRQISIIIGNDEIYDQINKLFPLKNDNSKIDLYIQFLEFFGTSSKDESFHPPFTNQNIYDYLASHFYSIEKKKLFQLKKSDIFSIISSSQLKLESEDSLIEFFDELFKQNGIENKNDINLSKTEFYEQINFESLSEKFFCDFLDQIDPFELNSSFWKRLCIFIRMNLKKNEKSKNENNDRYLVRKKTKITEIEFKGNEFKGIIFNLSDGDAKNLLNKKIIDVTSSSVYCDNLSVYNPWNVVDFVDKSSFWSQDSKNSWLCYDFKDKKVKPSKYSIRSNNYDKKGWYHPKSWVIEGSNDEENWKVLDSKENDYSLDQKYMAKTFNISKKLGSDDFFKFIRIKQTDLNTHNTNQLTFSSLEFYGLIIC